MKNKYYCKHCKKTVVRNSDSAWINSSCIKTGKGTRLLKVKLS